MRKFINDQYALFFNTLWVLWTLFYVFNIFLFFKNKFNLYIKCRFPSLTFCSSIGQYLIVTTLTWEIIILPENFLSVIDCWFVWAFIPLSMFPYIMRSLRFILKYNLQKYDSEEESVKQKHHFLRWCKKKKNIKYTTDKAFFIYNWIILALCIITAISRHVIHHVQHFERYGIRFSGFSFMSCICILILGNIFLWISVYLLSKTDEKLYITIELLITGILWDIFIPLYVFLLWFGDFDYKIPTILLIIENMISFLISFGMPVQLSIVKKPNFISNVEKLNTLEGLLDDEQGKSLFLDFLTFNKDCKECLLFHQEVNEYVNIIDDNERKTKFMWIKKTYIQNGSPYHVNVSSKLIDKVMNIKPEDASSDSFKQVYQSNLSVLKTDAFREFKTTSEFKKYVNIYKSNHFDTKEN